MGLNCERGALFAQLFDEHVSVSAALIRVLVQPVKGILFSLTVKPNSILISVRQ
jgi:hypothetical protein